MTATTESPVTTTPLLRRIPWDGIVTITNEHPGTLSQALLEAGGLDWEVGVRPFWRTIPVPDITSNPQIYSDGNDGIPPGKYDFQMSKRAREVFRIDPGSEFDQRELGIVRTRYTPLPNREIFAFGDMLVKDGHGMWHAAGQQNGGERVLMIMKLQDEFDVLGDAHQMFMLFRSAHDGSGAIRADAIPFRLKCFNQNQVGNISGAAKASWRVLHTTNLKNRLAEAEVSLTMAIKYRDEYMALCEKLSGLPVMPEQGAQLIQKMVKKGRTRREEVIADIEHNWLTSVTIPDTARFTGWGLLNAVTEYFGHICDRRGGGNSLYESIMNGEAKKAREILVRLLTA